MSPIYVRLSACANVHIRARLSIGELNQPVLDHVERRIPLGMLIEHLPPARAGAASPA
jgi:hypothetical protein